jgi:hypothetical protein
MPRTGSLQVGVVKVARADAIVEMGPPSAAPTPGGFRSLPVAGVQRGPGWRWRSIGSGEAQGGGGP